MTATACARPGNVPRGTWKCRTQEEQIPDPDFTFHRPLSQNSFPSKIISSDSINCVLSTALQCRLDCDAGYVSDRPPVVTCVDGKYEPARPQDFNCTAAAVLVITVKGDVEIFSDKKECQSHVTENFSNFTGVGRTVSLLDDQILLVGGDLDATKYTYISINNPRRGLHAMKYSVEKYPLEGSPHAHAALGSGNRLLVLGGLVSLVGPLCLVNPVGPSGLVGLV